MAQAALLAVVGSGFLGPVAVANGTNLVLTVRVNHFIQILAMVIPRVHIGGEMLHTETNGTFFPMANGVQMELTDRHLVLISNQVLLEPKSIPLELVGGGRQTLLTLRNLVGAVSLFHNPHTTRPSGSRKEDLSYPQFQFRADLAAG